jgi:hypothetical protein
MNLTQETKKYTSKSPHLLKTGKCRWKEKMLVGFYRAKSQKKVKERIRCSFSQYDHQCLYTIFSIRPSGRDPNPDKTNTKYCHYDFANKNYAYQESWVDFIVKLFEVHRLTIEEIRLAHKAGEKWDINEYC